MHRFSENIRFLRESKGLKQYQVADNLGITRTAWSNYENGTSVPNLELFCRISKYFDVTETILLNEDLSKGNLNSKEPDKKYSKKGNLNCNPSGNLKEENLHFSESKEKLEILKVALNYARRTAQTQEELINSLKAHISRLEAENKALKEQAGIGRNQGRGKKAG